MTEAERLSKVTLYAADADDGKTAEERDEEAVDDPEEERQSLREEMEELREDEEEQELNDEEERPSEEERREELEETFRYACSSPRSVQSGPRSLIGSERAEGGEPQHSLHDFFSAAAAARVTQLCDRCDPEEKVSDAKEKQAIIRALCRKLPH